MQIEELAGVLLDGNGAPLSFSYQGKSYLVGSKPMRWYSRKLWWESATAAPKGVGSSVMETEMWRLRASCGSSFKLFELIHQMPEDIWVVQEVH